MNNDTHYLIWQKGGTRMACGKRDTQVLNFETHWKWVNCADCMAAQKPEHKSK